MNQTKILFRTIIFFIIGILILQLLTIILVPKWMLKIDPATPRWQEFYEQEEDTIDVLLIGNSDVGRGLSPITLWKEYGITSFNLGTSNQSMLLSYYIIQEAIKYHSPETIVLDMDALFDKREVPEGEYRKLLDNMKMSKNKINIIMNEDINLENKLSYIFPIMRFHSRWNSISKEDFKFYRNYAKTITYKGMAINNDIEPYIDTKKYMDEKGKTANPPELNVKYFEKIVELCKQNNIKLLMIELPSATSWSSAKSKSTSSLAEKHDLEFIDMNYLLEEMNFNWLTDTADKGNHLNIDGAEKVSRFLGKILKTKYESKDHREEKKYEDWNNEVIRYEKDKYKLNIKSN